MNKFKCCGYVKEFDCKTSGYTSKMWVDGEKTDKDMNIKTYRGRMSVEIEGNIVTFDINTQDRRLFMKSEDVKKKNFPINKSYENIEKFIKNNSETRPLKVRITGELIDNPYYSKVKDQVMEITAFRADFITVVPDETPDEFYLNATTFILKAAESDNGEFYKLKAYVSPAWGKKYFPIRSSNKDEFIYVDADSMQAIYDNCSEDGEKFTNSLVATYKLKFVQKGGGKPSNKKSFGHYEEMSSGWTEQELWIIGGEFVEPIIIEKENDEGEVEEVITNANQIIIRKECVKANKERPTMLEGVKTKYMEYEQKKKTVKSDDLDDLDDLM